MKNLFVKTLFVCLISATGIYQAAAQEPLADNCEPIAAKLAFSQEAKIQVALLLDASNSMDGLIEQAKSRLWNIVNTLTTLKYDGQTPQIEIALYMYGNDGLDPQTGYIKQLNAFTSDLDLISEKLFAITTNGGSEYCGAVIGQAVKKLEWGDGKDNMKLIYIAGNERFNQGDVSYIESISDAKTKDIYINTIHCGDYSTGVTGYWKNGADRGRGKYYCINPDEKVIYVATPYDDQINKYNIKLNNTYIFYGSGGYSGWSNQSKQDLNALGISNANITERAVSKSSKAYRNDAWDLVDKVSADPEYISKVEKKTLPEEYQSLTKEQLKAEIEKKSKERQSIQNEIHELNKKRMQYIQSNTISSGDDFGKAVNESVIEVAKVKGYEVK